MQRLVVAVGTAWRRCRMPRTILGQLSRRGGAIVFDAILRGGIVVGASAEQQADVAILDGRIAALLHPGEAAEAATVIDVGDRYLLPGLVDVHAHLREPGAPQKETFQSGTRAAALGGVTTVLAMPNDPPWTETAELLTEKYRRASGRIAVDVGFQAVLGRDASGYEALAAEGPMSFELFTVDVPEPYRFDTADRLAEALKRHRGSSHLFGIAAGEQSIVDGSRIRKTRLDPIGYARTRPPEEEASGVAKAILAAAASGTRVHLRQINSRLALRTFARMRDLADVTVETTPHNLVFTESDYEACPSGFVAGIKASPPFRSPADVEALRQALRSGAVDMVASDHAPHTLAEKRAPYEDFADIPPGIPGLQTILFAMLSLVEKGVLGLADLVRLCATNPACRFGLGDRKGSIAKGMDADLIVLDPRGNTVVTDESQVSGAGYTPFDGLSVHWALSHVLLRGNVIAGTEAGTGADRAFTGGVLRH